MMDFFPDAALAPTHEALVDGARLAEAFGQVFPGSTGACDPEDRVDKQTVVVRIAAELAGLSGKQAFDATEVVVGDGVAVHGVEANAEEKAAQNALTCSVVPPSVNSSFVRTT